MVGGQHHAPEKTRYQLYRRLGGLQDQSGRVRRNSPPPGFDPRTVQPVARRYADWAIPAYIIIISIILLLLLLLLLLSGDIKSAH